MTTSSQPATLLEPILLWPDGAPDLNVKIGAELDTTPHDTSTPHDGIIRLGNVTQPTITVFKPKPELDTGAAIVVCPGGGYHILAYNLEGSEVCAWLNSIGVTGVLLKYRVPGRLSDQYRAPLQDAQRALSLVRNRAAEWNLDPQRIGILGFSAGAHLAAVAGAEFHSRAYQAVDQADELSCRPDFALLIYPAYLTTDLTQIAPELKITSRTPPAFIVQTQDDSVPVENAYVYALALKNAGVSAELHVYPSGGHGYGLRPSSHAVSSWPQRAAEWLSAQGWTKPS